MMKESEFNFIDFDFKTIGDLVHGKIFGEKKTEEKPLKEIKEKYFQHQKIHKVTEHNFITYCGPCDKTFKNPNSLKAHIKDFHTKERIPQLCTQCGKSFNKKSNLNAHMLNSHTTFEPIDCTCSLWRKLLKIHQA